MSSPGLKLPSFFRDDLDHLNEEILRFKSGAISVADFRPFGAARGIYEQREAGTYMLRARCPAGIVLPDQMRTLARVSRQFGDGVLHLTTRQDIQVHGVLLDNIHPALVELIEAGLGAKGGGGNTVRNISGCSDAGVCPNEAFDISSHVVALTESLLPDPHSYQLPRKYKIAFSGCSRDCSGATVADLGFVAHVRDGVRGFAVYIGGGLGSGSRVGQLFEEFVPASEVFRVAEAVKRVFDQHGNRQNRNRARLRFLIQEIGLPKFREFYQRELAAIAQQAGSPEPAEEVASKPPALAAIEPAGQGFELWARRNVAAQKQANYHLVQIPLPLGDIAADRLSQLADVVEQCGRRELRATLWQNFTLRWVHTQELPGLYRSLAAIGLANSDAPLVRNVVACTGASICRLGFCLSRGLARAMRDRLSSPGVDLESLGNLRIQISGCPNSCSRHPVADIGLFGAVRRLHGHMAPHYVMQLGGRLGEGRSRLAEGEMPVPAKNVPALVSDLLLAFQRSPQCPDFDAFLEAGGRALADQLAIERQSLPTFEQDCDGYIDWDATKPFSSGRT
jgi:sulfite reductase (ferredoxin)